VYDTINIEDLNKPAVVLCHHSFITDGTSAASGKGVPAVRIISENVPSDCSVFEKIEAGAIEVIDQIIDGLTMPLTEEEKSPKPKEVEKLSGIVFKGDLYEVNQFFYKRGWSDGLPLFPPTEEAVKEMLTGTDLPADHVVSKIIPRMGKATVEKIAINAVMAGALPTYMPVLIAAVQTLADTRTNFGTFEVSTASWAPFWIVNGPIRNDININCSSGALSPGNIANAAIGRAMSLIIKNIGGARKAVEDMGTLGNPGKYTMVIGEKEEDSPWEPLQVEQGYKKEDNTISVIFPNCSVYLKPYGTDDKGLLTGAVYNIVPCRRGPICWLMPPQHAKTLADKGWTKKQISSYISQYARVPAHHHTDYVRGEPGIPPKELVTVNPTDTMPIIYNPDWVRVVVAGGPGNQMGLFQAQWIAGSDWVTHKIELPSNWDKLVKKYKSLVPTYFRY
jgi:hypothetical protein